MAFGIISIMLCLGMVIRAKIPFIRNTLAPASVIAGIMGFIFINLEFFENIDTSIFNTVVQHLFTLSFISIGLTSNPKSKTGESSIKSVAKGSLGLGMIWNILYAFTPIIGGLLLYFIGNIFGMHPVYGLLIPFGFSQGPGQAATFGAIFEQYGWTNASMVGVTFAAIGFIVAFFVGVPLAKYGLRKGLSVNNNKIDDYVKRGYYNKNESSTMLGKETTFSGNIETITFHFAIIGIVYVLSVFLADIISNIPGIGETIASMLFMVGMIVAYGVKYIMKKLNIDHLIDNQFQGKLTGWATDYLIVASFMAVQMSVVGNWIIPIIIVSLIVALVTFVVSLYFGRRIGGENDFERTLGLFGTATGTVPSGMALIRIVDPTLNTTTGTELGMMNLPMMFSYVTLATILAMAEGTLSFELGLVLLFVPIPAYLIAMKILKVWNDPTYQLKGSDSKSSVRTNK